MQIEMVLRLSPYIDGIPNGKESAWKAATNCDELTIKSWEKQWVDQTAANSKNYDFVKNSAFNAHMACYGKPVILMGAGPSLKKNWKELVGDGDKSIGRKDLKIVAGVHNFPFCEDRNLMTSDDYYIVLDAGDITIREMSEGGSHDPDWYWDRTKDRTLIAYHGTHPGFIAKWKGPVLWYTTPYASLALAVEISKYVDISKTPGFNVGGNVMGAAMYFARAVLGCSIPVFIGMDLCFSYDHKFHAWDSQYDAKFSGVMPWIDIYGNRVWTWGSYFGFKNWFDYMACGGSGNNAHLWINATEGGIMGAYHEGNIRQIIQIDLKTVLHMFNMSNLLPEMLKKSVSGQMHLLF